MGNRALSSCRSQFLQIGIFNIPLHQRVCINPLFKTKLPISCFKKFQLRRLGCWVRLKCIFWFSKSSTNNSEKCLSFFRKPPSTENSSGINLFRCLEHQNKVWSHKACGSISTHLHSVAYRDCVGRDSGEISGNLKFHGTNQV